MKRLVGGLYEPAVGPYESADGPYECVDSRFIPLCLIDMVSILIAHRFVETCQCLLRQVQAHRVNMFRRTGIDEVVIM